jgi:hypothetical protein
LIQNVVSQLTFSFYRHRPIQADFSGGQLTSDGGLLPLRAFDQRHHLTESVTKLLCDGRDLGRIKHALPALLSQRLYGIVAGYEDANDAQRLRLDPVFQMLADYSLQEPLGSQPTLSRWENSVTAKEVVGLNHLLVEWFVRICGRQVRQRGEIVLDLDSTEDPTHGQQQLSLFNGHFRETCYHPLLLFERHSGCLLSVRLRRGNCVSYNRAMVMLRPVLKRLRAAFPEVAIRFCGDAGFAVPELYELLEEYGVRYAIRFPSHCFVQQRAEELRKLVEQAHQDTGREYRLYTVFHHYAPRWGRARRLCVEIHYPDQQLPVRAIVTNMDGSPQQVTQFYNGRGECENRIEELKNGFHADRLSCHRFVANCFRLLLHSLAYNLVNFFRQRHLPLPWRSLQIETLRVQFFKLGAQIYRTARCIRVRFATGWPFAPLFCRVAGSFSSA